MIPLQNLSEQHIGFLLLAGKIDFMSKVGAWEGDCVFMALPTKSELFEDPSFLVLSKHKAAGEHRFAMSNDGSKIRLVATAQDGAQLFAELPMSAPGIWGVRVAGVETKMGYAVKVQRPEAA